MFADTLGYTKLVNEVAGEVGAYLVLSFNRKKTLKIGGVCSPEG